LKGAAMYETSGDLLVERRLEAGLSQAALAEKAGIDVRTVERIEAGEKLQQATVRALARALGVRHAALWGCEFDETKWDVTEIPFDPHDEGGLAGQIGISY
jgi:transcriptional regulator with XRE-family HTH domain